MSEEQNENTLDLLPPKLSETPLMMSMGMIFAMMKCVLRLENSSKKRSVFLRNDIGIFIRQNGACFIKLASAKLQHKKG